MNYIKRLEQENRDLRKRIDAGQDLIRHYRAFLESPKFARDHGLNGERSDWVSTADVNLWLLDIGGQLSHGE